MVRALGELHEIIFLAYHFSIQLLTFCWDSLFGSSFKKKNKQETYITFY